MTNQTAPRDQDVQLAPAASDPHANRLFWLLPHFSRWAQARALQSRQGGDLSLQQLTVLYLVRTEGATLSQMARRLMVAPTVLTGIVDRLERRGYIWRENDPTDRRKLKLCLSDEGRRISIAVENALVAAVSAEIATCSPTEIADLDRGLTVLERIITRLESVTPLEA